MNNEDAKGLVSIVVPTHNRSVLLQRALNSLLKQTYKNIEIIVVDDGSVDNTQELLRDKYSTENIVTLKNCTSQGAPVARNKGIGAAQGEFITFLDDDDEFKPERIEKMMAAWDDKWAYISTGRDYIKNNGRKEIQFLPEVIELDAMLYQHVAGNSVLTKTSRIQSLGGFDESLTSSQDYDMWLRLNIAYGSGYCVQESLCITHTEHEAPRITSSINKTKGHLAFYKKHKHLMTRSQRKSKLFEIYRYKNKKIKISKAMSLGAKKPPIEVLKLIVKSRIY